VSDLQRIEAALPENLRTNVGFTLISFDSTRDTPATLQAYRAKRELSTQNWTLLRGEPDDVRELAALLGVNLPARRERRFCAFQCHHGFECRR
jgi:protein SCO1/2